MGAAVLSWVLSAAACGGQPSAGDLWGQPDRSGARDAHATVVASGAAAAFQGDGTVVFKPRTAMSLRVQVRAGALGGQMDVLEVNGVTYQRGAADQKWTRSSVPLPDPTWAGASDPHVVAQERIGSGAAWHLRASRAGSPLDLWVRVSDGYPLQVLTRGAGGTTYRFVFDRFNTGDRVAAPAAFQLKPPARTVSGRIGDVLTLNGARVGVLSADD